MGEDARGVGAPPLETDYGWLTFYHAMDEKHPDRYKLGAMLLDRQNPQKIIGRCHQPIMEPEEVYENDGKPGVIYVCGSIIKNGKIFVYYGGADKVACVASAPLKKIINAILNKPDKISLEKVTAFNY